MAASQDLQNLLTRRSAILTELASLSSAVPGGKANTSGEGTSVDHQGYKKSLYDELDRIRELIETIDGGYEFTQVGAT